MKVKGNDDEIGLPVNLDDYLMAKVEDGEIEVYITAEKNLLNRGNTLNSCSFTLILFSFVIL